MAVQNFRDEVLNPAYHAAVGVDPAYLVTFLDYPVTIVNFGGVTWAYLIFQC
jgi:hypothetical protein